MFGAWKKRQIEFPQVEAVLQADPRPTFVKTYAAELLQSGRALKALISDIDWDIGPPAQYDWPDYVGITLLYDANGKRQRRKEKLSYTFQQAGNQTPKEHTHWFKKRIQKDQFVTLLFAEDDKACEGELRLFGELTPFVEVSCTTLLERFRADGSTNYALLIPLLDLISHELPENRPLKKALRSVSDLYTSRGHDDFYMVGDLHHAFRTKDISPEVANKVLDKVMSTVETKTIAMWAAD